MTASPRKSKSQRRMELRWLKSHPGMKAEGATANLTSLVGVLEGSSKLLKEGASVEAAAKEYSRQAVTAAMGRVRARMLAEGLCGVPRNGSSCVGSWCLPKGSAREWGILGGKAVVGVESDGRGGNHKATGG